MIGQFQLATVAASVFGAAVLLQQQTMAFGQVAMGCGVQDNPILCTDKTNCESEGFGLIYQAMCAHMCGMCDDSVTSTAAPAAGTVPAATIIWGEATTESDASVTVMQGDSVLWLLSLDRKPHNIVSGTELNPDYDANFNSPIINAGDTWTYQFNAVGSFPYFCSPHPWMKGTITVVAPTTAPTTATAVTTTTGGDAEKCGTGTYSFEWCSNVIIGAAVAAACPAMCAGDGNDGAAPMTTTVAATTTTTTTTSTAEPADDENNHLCNGKVDNQGLCTNPILCTNIIVMAVTRIECPVMCGTCVDDTSSVTPALTTASPTTTAEPAGGENDTLCNGKEDNPGLCANPKLCNNSIAMDIFQEECPVMCGTCIEATTVGPDGNNTLCKGKEDDSGLCTNPKLCSNPIASAVFQEECPVMCGTCAGGDDSPPECTNLDDACPDSDEACVVGFVRAACPVLCGTCGVQPASTTSSSSLPACDGVVDNQGMCQAVELCTEAGISELMQEQCPILCGTCSGEVTNGPGTTTTTTTTITTTRTTKTTTTTMATTIISDGSSCKDLDGTCPDSIEACELPFIQIVCPKLCGTCTTTTTTATATDQGHILCNGKSDQPGLCNEPSLCDSTIIGSVIQEKCPIMCNTCPGSITTDVTVASTTVSTLVPATEDVDSEVCEDNLTICPSHDLACGVEYIRFHCKQLCGLCPSTSTTSTTAVSADECEKEDNEILCSDVALCSNSAVGPLVNIECPHMCGWCVSSGKSIAASGSGDSGSSDSLDASGSADVPMAESSGSSSKSPAVDPCMSFKCGMDCKPTYFAQDGAFDCGWSKVDKSGGPDGTCISGGKTSEEEQVLGDCQGSTASGFSGSSGSSGSGSSGADISVTTSTEATITATIDPCNQHGCGADCVDECGWSKADVSGSPDGTCITGGKTSEEEMVLGNCTATSTATQTIRLQNCTSAVHRQVHLNSNLLCLNTPSRNSIFRLAL